MKNITALFAAMLISGCAQMPGSQARLVETYWKAVEIEGKPVAVRAGAREPHLILRADKFVANGSSGCNSFRGAYELAGDSLRFKAMASTMMACLPEVGDVEKKFLSAINATASQRVSGETLELRDADGKVRARFESRYTK